MKQLKSTALRRRRSLASRGFARRALRRILRFKLGLLALLVVIVGLGYLRLAAGPVSFGKLPERFAASLAERIGPGWHVRVRNTSFELREGALSVLATGLDIRNPDGVLVVRAPHAVVSLDTFSLLTAAVQPRSIEFRDLQIRAVLNPDGAITFVPQAEADEPHTAASTSPPPSASRSTAPVSPVSTAVTSLLQMLVGHTGILGALDEARVTNARLTLVDADGQERARFRRVDAVFARGEAGGRRFDASLEGPDGAWHMAGEAHAGAPGAYRAAVTLTDAPAQDLMILSGLSAVPATFNVKISGGAEAVLANGRIERLQVNLAGQPGVVQVHDKDTSPLAVEEAQIQASWDEQRRVLALPVVSFKGGGSAMQLAGELATGGDVPWRLSLEGRGAVLGGAQAGDRPVSLDTILLQAAGGDGVKVERLWVSGPGVQAEVAGVIGSADDPRSLALTGNATNSDVRAVLRLWPEAVGSATRRYLVKNLKSGTAESFSLSVALSGAELSEAIAGGPLRDDALNVRFAVRDAELTTAEGLPPLSGAPVTGLVTGKTAKVAVPSARVTMPDGRALSLADGSFEMHDFWAPGAAAQIGTRLQGGADAVGSLLQSPLMREIAGLDLDPAGMKGRGEFRVHLALALDHPPSMADLPLTVTGAVTDLSIDKLVGKERLEGANLTVRYDRGALAIKGEGKLGGSPSIIDISQGPGQPGEAVLHLTLDEAARARRGLGFGTQLSGPVLVRAAMPLGRPKGPTRFEIDLSKATVDQAVPGWTKPAGRPGKLTFALADVQSGSELRDIVLESGSVHIRGTALLGADGQLDKADLGTFKLSPGDDMRAHVERAGSAHKVTVRGNVGDARPFAKAIAPGAQAAPRGPVREAKDARDLDLDLQVNILTGYSDEVITNASLKASLRQHNLRQLHLTGRLGPSNLSAQTVTRSGVPMMVLQADDAGRLLRFLDIYRRMEGGKLHIQLGAGEGPQAGVLTLDDFTLRNEPALSRIIPTHSQLVRTEDASGRSRSVLIDVNEVYFTRAKMDFVRSAGRLDFRDAAIFGRQVGFTLSGFLDYGRDRTDISGTFVPAFGVNNAFAQLPLFGPLLSGGRHEGLFAVNFRISGQASAPALTVNPLSAVAPGFLRKLFGAGAAPTAGSDIPPMPIPDR